MTVITSPSNPRISKLQTLYTPRGRKKNGLFLMEGLNLLEALLDAHLFPQEVYYQPALLQRTARGNLLLDRLLHTPEAAHGLVEVSERVLDAISDVQTTQGVVSVLPLNAFDSQHIRTNRSGRQRPALLVLDDLADPGNMGTILRTALAADVDTVLLTPDCVDYLSPKVVRAAAGAHVALPVEANLSWSAIEEKIALHCAGVPRVLLAEASGEHLYYDQDLKPPFALVVGNEAHGPSHEARERAT
ncbi:MAG: RNA methyltransferase, partial [Ktedonobacteraceae bacterium]|nr:RNA methyltransferase [Ktedonobacteraceae bacterium]